MVNIIGRVLEQYRLTEADLGKEMLAYEREKAKLGKRPKLPCDERPKRQADMTYDEYPEVISARKKRDTSYAAIYSVIEPGVVVSFADVMNVLDAGINKDGWLTRGSAATYMKQMADDGYLFILPKEISGGNNNYIKTQKMLP
tara:strand:+ start:901 stop:1329 length:429 start_codon:yes stop_codon:yes gene_type:complete